MVLAFESSVFDLAWAGSADGRMKELEVWSSAESSGIRVGILGGRGEGLASGVSE